MAVPADVVEQMAAMLRLDGADLVVAADDGTELRVTLMVESASCAECVLPHDHLVAMLEENLRQAASPRQVVLDDPRRG